MQSIHRMSRSLCLVILILLSSIISVEAQEFDPQTPPSLAALDPSVSTMPSLPDASISPGYWIVASHASPQDFDSSAPRFCPNVTLYEQSAGFRRTSMEDLTQSIQPGIPICIFCHGSFVSWDDVLHESCETWKWLHRACPNQQVQMIYFSWPSDRPVFSPVVQLDVNRLGRRAGRNGFYMASLVQQIPSECPVCFVGHSHGTRVIASSLHLMGGGAVEDYVLAPGPYSQHRMRAVFAASAMDHNWLNPGYRYDRALSPVECILNLRNSCDAALFIYPLRHPFSGGALGYTGVTRRDSKKLSYCGQKIQELDLTENIGVAHRWPNYFSRPWLAHAMRDYLFFTEPSANP